MIQLQQTDLDPDLAVMLSATKVRFRDRTAAAWICGPGYAFLPRMKGHTRHYAYLFADREPFFTLPAIDNSVLQLDGLAELQNALVVLRAGHRSDYPTTRPRGFDPETLDCTIVMRPNAYIVLPANRSRTNLYVPMPDTSAHELLSDRQQLEHEFPGVFVLS